MISTKSLRTLLVCASLLILPSAVSAQELPLPRLTISGGYQFLSDPAWDTYHSLGWVGSVNFKVHEAGFLVAEGSGGFGDVPGTGFNIERYAILGGIKAMRPGDGARIFVQVLAGLSRQAGDVGILNGFIAQPGGGVEWPINDRFYGRVYGDYRFLREDGQNHHGFRAGAGLVLVLWR